MKVREFLEKDFAVIKKWKEARDPYFPKRGHFPEDGFMVEGVACVFLIRTNCGMAFLEFLMSNPEVPLDERLRAFDMLIVEAERMARFLGYDTLTGNTMIPKVMALGMRYGFNTDGKTYYFFRKELNNARSSAEPIPYDGSGINPATYTKASPTVAGNYYEATEQACANPRCGCKTSDD